MVMNLRDWLVILGILVVLGILVDGLRRIWVSRKRANELHFGLEKNQGLSRVQEELPNGGARLTRDVSMPKGRVVSAPGSIQQQEPEVSSVGSVVSPARTVSQEQQDDPFDDDIAPEPELTVASTGSKRILISDELADNDPILDMDDIRPLTDLDDDNYPNLFDDEDERESIASNDTAAKQDAVDQDAVEKEEFLVINVEAVKGTTYTGEQLQAFFAKEHLHFGAMNIFHRHAKEDGQGAVLFSAVNGMKPGIFDMETMPEMSTPVLSFFMGLPGPENPQQAFRHMVECVYNLTKELGGTLKDDQHSGLTVQTLEHYRERICDFERRNLSARRRTSERA